MLTLLYFIMSNYKLNPIKNFIVNDLPNIIINDTKDTFIRSTSCNCTDDITKIICKCGATVYDKFDHMCPCNGIDECVFLNDIIKDIEPFDENYIINNLIKNIQNTELYKNIDNILLNYEFSKQLNDFILCSSQEEHNTYYTDYLLPNEFAFKGDDTNIPYYNIIHYVLAFLFQNKFKNNICIIHDLVFSDIIITNIEKMSKLFMIYGYDNGTILSLYHKTIELYDKFLIKCMSYIQISDINTNKFQYYYTIININYKGYFDIRDKEEVLNYNINSLTMTKCNFPIT